MKIAVVGAGHLGKIHIKCIQQIPGLELVGFYDEDPVVQSSVQKEQNIKAFSRIEESFKVADIIDIVTPTPSHYGLALKALKHGKHVFIEKPITTTSEEAKKLHKLSQDLNLKIQVGHVERFNPAFMAVRELGEIHPLFIEGHRLAQFNPRGTDVSVILDLMIHDLDLILALVPYKVTQIQASGVAVVSNTADICNARIEFENGCVANLTSSRISLKNMRKLRLFQNNAYISVDMLEKELQVIRLFDKHPASPTSIELDTSQGKKWIEINQPKIEPNNAILEELKAFTDAIRLDLTPKVSALDACQSISLAEKIEEQVQFSFRKMKSEL